MHLSATSLKGTKVRNNEDEDLGKLEDLMINTDSGSVDYAVLSFGGFMGMGDKLFAVPMTALRVDPKNEELVLNARKEALKDAPGFDKDNWPDTADATWQQSISRYYDRVS